MEKVNTIGRDFTTRELIRFAAPPVLSQFAMSLLATLDDGLFLSRFVGADALAAFSIAMPLFMLMMAISELFNGASVLCATEMGEGKNEDAQRHFTSIVILAGAFGILASMAVMLFMDPLIRFLGGTEILFPYVKAYFRVGVWYVPLILVNHVFSRFYVPAGKPKMALIATLTNAFLNFSFDYVFMVRMQIGMTGSALANLIANVVVFIIGMAFFSRKSSEIHFARPVDNMFSTLFRSVKFGFPPFLTHIAIAVNSFIANQVLLYFGGEGSVSAYTIINNIQFMFMSGIFGLSGAVTPIVSYAYGEQNRAKILKIIGQIIQLTTGLVAVIILFYLLGKSFLLNLYLKSDSGRSIRDMADYGLTVAPLGFLFFGYNVLAIDTFLALHEKRTSTILTVLENVICANITIFVLPYLFGITGVWFAFPVGEIMTFAGTLYFVLINRNRFGDPGQQGSGDETAG